MNQGDLPTARRLQQRQQAQDQAALEARVVVTVLGDGAGTAGYEKRLAVREHLLSNVDSVLEVTIPEELASSHPEAELDDVEASAIETAHVVLCIEAPDQVPLGLYTELARYFRPAEADKWYRLRPIDRPAPAEHPSLVAGLASELIARIDDFPYPPDRWDNCEFIRTACANRVTLTALRRRDALLEQTR